MRHDNDDDDLDRRLAELHALAEGCVRRLERPGPVPPAALLAHLDAAAARARDHLGPLGERDRASQDAAIRLTAALDCARWALRDALHEAALAASAPAPAPVLAAAA